MKQAPFTTRIKEATPSRYGTMVWDDVVRGLGCRVYPAKAEYVVRYRTRDGKQRLHRLGLLHGGAPIGKVRERAADLRERVRKGGDPVKDDAEAVKVKAAAQAARKTVADVLDEFYEKHVVGLRPGEGLRPHTQREYRQTFDRLVKPAIGDVEIGVLRRDAVRGMLDDIAAGSGLVMADRTLAYLRKALAWWAVGHEGFASPIVRGMSYTKPRERARDRVLDDDELRALWAATEPVGSSGGSSFAAYVRLVLLSSQRPGEVGSMQRGQISAEGVWEIPATAYKTRIAHVVPLPKAALDIIKEQPPRPDGYVFSPWLQKSGKPKAALDKALEKAGTPLPAWTLHDLRRTGRTLMARIGIADNIAERVQGHVIAGVQGVYNRYAYIEEKRAALEALAAQVERILHPVENVLPMVRSAAG